MSQQTKKIPWYKEIGAQRWKAFFAAWIGVVLDGYDFVLISLVLSEIIDTFSLTLVEGTALVSAAFISRWFGGLVLGAMGDKHGRKPAMIASILLFTIGSLMCGLAPNWTVLFLARLLIGFAMAGEYSSSATYIIELWPVRMRNRASGFMLSGYAVGSILAAQIYRLLVPWVDSWHPNWGWRALFLTGMIPILVALYMRRRLPEAEDWESVKQSDDNERLHEGNMLTILYRGKNRVVNYLLTVLALTLLLLIFTSIVHGGLLVTLLALVCAVIFVWFVYQSDPTRWAVGVAIMLTIFCSFIYTWPILGLLPTYLKSDLSMDAGLVAAIVSYANLGNMCGYILSGFLGDKLGMRRWYVISLLLSQVLVFPCFMVGGKYAVLIGILLFFQQMFGQGISGLAPKWVSSYFPIEKRAAGLGFCYNVGALGGAVGPIVGASISSAVPLGIALATISVGGALVVILSVGLNLPRRIQAAINPATVRPEDGMDESELPTLDPVEE